MKKTFFLLITMFSFSTTFAQLAQQDFEGPISSPWQGNGTIVGSQGGNWNTHAGGGMYDLQYNDYISVSLNLPPVTKFIGLWINQSIPVYSTISVDLQNTSGGFVQNIGTQPASNSGYWYYYQYELGAGYTGNYRIAISRSYSNSSAASNSSYIDDIAITSSQVGLNTLSENDFKLYPNPVSDQFNLVFKTNVNNLIIEITDLTGKIVYSENDRKNILANQTQIIDVSELNSGIYVCKISNGENSITQKIVVE